MSREVDRDAGGTWPAPADDVEADHYRTLVAGLGEGLFRVDADGRFVAVDDAFTDLLGYPAEHLEGSPFSTVAPDEEAERFARAVAERGEDDVPEIDIELRGADGRTATATLAVERLGDEGAGAIAAVTSAEPVVDPPGPRPPPDGSDGVDVEGGSDVEGGPTGMVDGAHERERFRALTEAARDVIVTIDEDSTIESINPAVEDLFGYEPAELIGEPLTVLMPDELAARHEDALERYIRTGERTLEWDYVELEGRHADGYRVPLAISFGEVRYDGERHFTGIIRDITERQAYQTELRQFEKLVEESTDVISIVDESGEIEYTTPSARRVLGYTADDLETRNGLELIHPDDRLSVRAELDALLSDPAYRAEATFRLRHSDGSWVVVQARARNLLDDPHVGGIVVYTHDITERRRSERQLEAQRERLSALNQLNGVVRGVTAAVIDRSTREEIEAITCERLADSDSYSFAWIGALDPRAEGLAVRARSGLPGGEGSPPGAGAHGDATDGAAPAGPAEAAIREGETIVVEDVDAHAAFEGTGGGDGPGAPDAGDVPIRSFAAIPIGHEDTVYGVLGVGADRAGAFRNEERTVVAHLGEIVGHAIAATERKQALMSDSVLELEIEIDDPFGPYDAADLADATVRIDQVLSVGDDEFLVYGVADESAMSTLRSLGADIAHWGEVTRLSEAAEGVRFEVGLTEPPVLSAVASLGGSVRRARIEDGEYRLTVQFPEGTDARQVLDTVREHFPDAEVLARRQVTRSETASERFSRAWMQRLTDRQRTALEVAYHAGFFAWPRESSGEEVAESIGVAAPTFHQHVRAAERKLFDALLEEADPGATARPSGDGDG